VKGKKEQREQVCSEPPMNSFPLTDAVAYKRFKLTHRKTEANLSQARIRVRKMVDSLFSFETIMPINLSLRLIFALSDKVDMI
jgi:hypothetical protein